MNENLRPVEKVDDAAKTSDFLGFEYQLHDNIGHLLRTANQFAVAEFNKSLANIVGIEDITTTQFATLTTIARFPGISFSELSAFTSIDMPTLNAMITRLINRGLVTVEVNPGDKRSRRINLTEDGKQLASTLLENGIRIGEFISRNLTAAETRRLIKLLKKFSQFG
ncbi:MarR family winged helix-turn-helix transcriptional regulator [Roseovarius sp. TE539]|uniref:MarR family winged helix-turn-helix transcriptional regulator n=1 Tax=Roseovarius sp. TE539 TaxID=2249812 RepID=UPI0015EE7CC2|nr:MarR family transcriptional regulator [Roseovarius sp. TE539]